MSSDALPQAWRQQARWSAIADALKTQLARWRRIILAALIAAAFVAAVAGHLTANEAAQTALGFTAALIVVLAPFVRALRLSRGAVQNWTRARSASEALKREVFEYATATGEYRPPGLRDAALDRRVREIISRVGDLAGVVEGDVVPRKPPPAALQMQDYLQERVASQVETFYRPKALTMDRRERLLRISEWALAGAAVVAVVVAAAAGWSGALAWVGVVTTVSGALLSHREAERYEYLALSYRVTANRLDGLLAKWGAALAQGPLSESEEDALVSECEDAISAENQAWMATWTEAPRGL